MAVVEKKTPTFKTLSDIKLLDIELLKARYADAKDQKVKSF